MNNQIFAIDLTWEDLKIIRESLSNDDYVALRDNLTFLELPGLDGRAKFYADVMLCTVDDLQVLTRFNIKPIIKRVRGIFQESLSNIGVPEPNPKQQQIVNITIPNASLFAVQTLQVLENECTNYVQKWLDNGWRIVAVCPPNDCRRPTFILGHANAHQEPPQ